MSLRSKKVQPVVSTLPDDEHSRQRVAAWLGLLNDDLPRAFSDAEAGIPLGPEVSPVLGDADVAALRTLGLPAELVPQRTRLEGISAFSLKITLLGTILSTIGYSVVEGLGGMVAAIPESMLLYGLVIPTAVSFLVAVVGLPTFLTTGVIAGLRRQSSQSTRKRAEANVAALAGRGVHGHAAEVDGHARALARYAIQAQLPAAMEQDVLRAIEDSRLALRRSDTPSPALIEAIASELEALRVALDRQQTLETTADDVSAPLMNLRRTVGALRQG